MTDIQILNDLLVQADTIENPAWEYIQTVPHDDLMTFGRGVRFTPQNFSHSELMRAGKFINYRDRITTRYTWAIPAPDSLAFIVAILDGRPVVEIGAGSGYWAWMLSQLGVKVAAWDLHPIGVEGTWFSEEFMLKRNVPTDGPLTPYHPVNVGGPEVLKGDYADHVLFLCWPTMDPWAAEAVRNFEGDTIIYIGEDPGGCTADSDFFALVGEGCGCWGDDECDHKASDAIFERSATGPLTQWGGLHDTLQVFERKHP